MLTIEQDLLVERWLRNPARFGRAVDRAHIEARRLHAQRQICDEGRDLAQLAIEQCVELFASRQCGLAPLVRLDVQRLALRVADWSNGNTLLPDEVLELAGLFEALATRNR